MTLSCTQWFSVWPCLVLSGSVYDLVLYSVGQCIILSCTQWVSVSPCQWVSVSPFLVLSGSVYHLVFQIKNSLDLVVSKEDIDYETARTYVVEVSRQKRTVIHLSLSVSDLSLSVSRAVCLPLLFVWACCCTLRIRKHGCILHIDDTMCAILSLFAYVYMCVGLCGSESFHVYCFCCCFCTHTHTHTLSLIHISEPTRPP